MVLRFYPAVIDQAPSGGDFGAVFPDLPGCVSGGDSVQQAAANAAEALSLHIDGMREEGLDIPPPSAPNAPLPDWLAEVPGRTVARALIPVEMPGRAVRTNITLDEGLLARLDAAAAAVGTSRSGWIAEAVRARLRG
ncbi:MAG TPA: type II toxin-antitoxin system HicB family antitoxin [Acetobacteraceae bacterium]|nr:type II toxin-antitoxin system HicB family antitoxin [Acetobacteraceae bacterium]